jgi:hypothetical protein
MFVKDSQRNTYVLRDIKNCSDEVCYVNARYMKLRPKQSYRNCSVPTNFFFSKEQDFKEIFVSSNENSGSLCGDGDVVGLPACNAVWTCRKLQTVRRNIPPPSSGFALYYSIQESGLYSGFADYYSVIFLAFMDKIT